MGAAVSLVQDAFSVKNRGEHLYLTSEEIAEDQAALLLQRKAIRFCVENLYANAPVTIERVPTPMHHMKSAMITPDERHDNSPSQAERSVFTGLPQSCVVDPAGNIIVIHKSPNKSPKNAQEPMTTRLIHASALEALDGPPPAPLAPWLKVAHVDSLEVEWDLARKSVGDFMMTLIEKYEVAFRNPADARLPRRRPEQDVAGEARVENAGFCKYAPRRAALCSGAGPQVVHVVRVPRAGAQRL